MMRTALHFILWSIALPAVAEPAKTEVTPQQMVQEFYHWYVPITVKDQGEPPFVTALKKKGSLFDPELARALKEDAAAQARVEGEIVGLDWDPFLNSQDPGDRYVTGKVSTKDDRTLVEVHGWRSGRKSPTPDVIVELSRSGGRWIFTNFRSADGDDLLSALKTLRAARQKDPH